MMSSICSVHISLILRGPFTQTETYTGLCSLRQRRALLLFKCFMRSRSPAVYRRLCCQKWETLHSWTARRLKTAERLGRLEDSGRQNDENMSRKIVGSAQSRATFFRHSASLSLPAVLSRKVSICPLPPATRPWFSLKPSSKTRATPTFFYAEPRHLLQNVFKPLLPYVKTCINGFLPPTRPFVITQTSARKHFVEWVKDMKNQLFPKVDPCVREEILWL